jgi:hypothetical protein
MTLKTYICTLYLIAFLFSCKKTTRSRKIISVNPNDAEEVINFSQFVDSVKYVKLQTDSNCILGQVLSIEIKEKYIYAMDISQHSIVAFDKKGRYVSKLDKQGKGPDVRVKEGDLVKHPLLHVKNGQNCLLKAFSSFLLNFLNFHSFFLG